MSATIIQAKVFENSSAVLMARILRDDGYPVLPDEIDTIECKVFDADDNTQISNPVVTPDASLYASLQNPPAWVVDAIGFNFAVSISGDNFPEGNRLYQVELKFTPVTGDPYLAGDPFYVVYQLQTINILSE